MAKVILLTVLFYTIYVLQILPATSLEAVQRGRMPSFLTSHQGFYHRENNSILIFGGAIGFSATFMVHRYDLETDIIKSAGRFPHPVHAGGIGYDGNGTYYYLGGIHLENFEQDYLDTVWSIDPNNPAPVAVGNLPAAMAYSSVSDDGNGNIYSTGGRFEDSDSAEIYQYFPENGSFEVVADLPFIRFGAATTWANGYMYIFGGDLEGEHDIYKFHPTTREVTSVGTMGPWAYASAVTVGTDIYLVGGRDAGPTPFNMRKFDTISETLEEVVVDGIFQQVAFSLVLYIEPLHRIYILGGTYDDEYVYSIDMD